MLVENQGIQVDSRGQDNLSVTFSDGLKFYKEPLSRSI